MKELKTLPYFSLSQFSQFFSSRKVALVYISRYIKNKSIIKIREGYYVFAEYINELKISNSINSYIEFLATNIVYSPSYLSMEYVLFENSIIAENVYNFTLLTTNKTMKFYNIFGNYIYRSIKKDLFIGYNIVEKDGFIIYKATKEKALFDYFYLKTDLVYDLKYFEELRLNIKNINLTKFKYFVNYSKSLKMKKVFLFLNKLKGL